MCMNHLAEHLVYSKYEINVSYYVKSCEIADFVICDLNSYFKGSSGTAVISQTEN
jgi:hypothetical protein